MGIGWGAIGLSLWILGAASGEEMPVAVEEQGALFKKVLAYDRTLAGDEHVELLVVYAGEPTGAIGDIVWAFQEAGFVSSTTRDTDLPDAIERVSVVYFAPGVDVSRSSALCAEKGVLTISGVPERAEKGDVAIGIGVRDDRPEIVVHLGRLEAEGHEFSSELLRLSRVIR